MFKETSIALETMGQRKKEKKIKKEARLPKQKKKFEQNRQSQVLLYNYLFNWPFSISSSVFHLL